MIDEMALAENFRVFNDAIDGMVERCFDDFITYESRRDLGDGCCLIEVGFWRSEVENRERAINNFADMLYRMERHLAFVDMRGYGTFTEVRYANHAFVVEAKIPPTYTADDMVAAVCMDLYLDHSIAKLVRGAREMPSGILLVALGARFALYHMSCYDDLRRSKSYVNVTKLEAVQAEEDRKRAEAARKRRERELNKKRNNKKEEWKD